jgi:hypothetical protein
MAKKSMRNLAKIAAGLGAAYALSKMGKGTMDGTEGDFSASSTPEVKGRMEPTSRGTMDGTEGVMPESKKDFNEPGYKKIQRTASQRFSERDAFNKKVKAINEARSGMKNPRYNKGGSVHVKTKIGYSKPTKIC